MTMRILVLSGLLAVVLSCRPTSRSAAGAAPSEPACAILADSSSPEGYFEFQVDRPVRLERHGTASPNVHGRVIAKFTVDTAGRPLGDTFKVIVSPSPELVAPARAVMEGSRYRPALRHGCRVNQIVMEPYVF